MNQNEVLKMSLYNFEKILRKKNGRTLDSYLTSGTIPIIHCSMQNCPSIPNEIIIDDNLEPFFVDDPDNYEYEGIWDDHRISSATQEEESQIAIIENVSDDLEARDSNNSIFTEKKPSFILSINSLVKVLVEKIKPKKTPRKSPDLRRPLLFLSVDSKLSYVIMTLYLLLAGVFTFLLSNIFIMQYGIVIVPHLDSLAFCIAGAIFALSFLFLRLSPCLDRWVDKGSNNRKRVNSIVASIPYQGKVLYRPRYISLRSLFHKFGKLGRKMTLPTKISVRNKVKKHIKKGIYPILCFIIVFALPILFSFTLPPFTIEITTLECLICGITVSIPLVLVAITAFKKHSKQKLKALLVILFLVLFPTILGWTSAAMYTETCPTPTFGMVSPTIQLSEEYDLESLDYLTSPEDLDDITFHSLLVLKFKLSEVKAKRITFHAELIPINVRPAEYQLINEYGTFARSHSFGSHSFYGPIDKNVYFKVNFDESRNPILPGLYKLKVYYIAQDGLILGKASDVLEYQLRVNKEKIRFEQSSIPTGEILDKRGSIYSIWDNEALGWHNNFDTTMTDALGRPISGTVSLYLTKREKNDVVFGKLTDYEVKEDGRISYSEFTYSHYREYMQGKIEYSGTQSLFYDDTVHYEDCDVAQNKFVHTGAPSSPEFTTNGTDYESYNLNEFKVTNHLFYHHEFNLDELQFTKSPAYVFDSGPPDIIYLDINDDFETYIESPLIWYTGTVADIAHFSYNYELYNYGNPLDEIFVDLRTQVYRDGDLVHESIDYQDHYKKD